MRKENLFCQNWCIFMGKIWLDLFVDYFFFYYVDTDDFSSDTTFVYSEDTIFILHM